MTSRTPPQPASQPVSLAVSLADLERYYDAVPRPVARVEEVGPFTLFVAEEGTGWQFYARPRLGGEGVFTADDVRRVLDRQRELGVTRAIEWVEQTTPSLLPVVREAVAGLDGVELEQCPLLVLPDDLDLEGDDRVRVLAHDDPDIGWSSGAVHAAFDGTDEITDRSVPRRNAMAREGLLVLVAAYAPDGTVAGGGSAAPRGDTAELMGIGVPPSARRQGLGSAITRGLVRAARERGVTHVFLSAANDDAASIYRQVGFVDAGTACILEVAGDGD